MNHMPNKDPTLAIALLAWLMDNWPTVYGAALAVLTAWLRITYGGGSGRRRALESVLCGAITLAFISAFGWFGIPEEAAGFVGGMVGLIGVETIRKIAEHLLNAKLPKE